MSDKSFGDQTNRNVVKNPLLLSAVTGVSIEDLTNKAILLPVTPSEEVITRSESNQHTLAHQPPDQNANVKSESPKTDDDFDVNEYFARLQGTRYVSAPINSQIDNLETENLEEINLGETEPEREQQSLTADIAQNFSQLPNVLPHVASAVFSSFSNILSLKSRDPTPDDRDKMYPSSDDRDKMYPTSDVRDKVPQVAQSVPQDVMPPPKEPPVGGGGNFRIASKKKYAQIPGLSCGGLQGTYPPTNQPFPSMLDNTQPNKGDNNNESHINFFTPQTCGTNINIPYVDQANANFGPNLANQNTYEDTFNVGATLDISNVGSNSENKNDYSNVSNPTFDAMNANVRSSFANVQDIHMNVAKQTNTKEFGISMYAVKEDFKSPTQMNLNFAQEHQKEFEAKALPPTDNFALPQQSSQYPLIQGPTPVIPPPPLFSNRKDSQSSGKCVLPPSVARRITANHPVIKPYVSTPTVIENIFVPSFDQNLQAAVSQTLTPNLQPGTQPQLSNPSSIFMPTFPVSSEKSEPTLTSLSSIAPNTESLTVLKPLENLKPTLDSNLCTPPESETIVRHDSNVPMYNPESSFISSAPPCSAILQDAFESAPLSTGPLIVTSTIPPRSMHSATIASDPIIFTPNLPAKSISPSTYATTVPLIFTPSLSPDTSIPAVSVLASDQIMQVNTKTTVSASPYLSSSISTPTWASETTPLVSIPSPEPAMPIITLSLSQAPTMFDLTNPTASSRCNIGSSSSYDPIPPTFFNPLQYQNKSEQSTPDPNMSETKPLTEPPKCTRASNYRMTKKRPQYYSGPIVGVGAISNNLKPVLPPLEPVALKGDLFEPQSTNTQEFPSQPSLEIEPLKSPFDISKPATQPDYNTVFDLSRPTTELYEQRPTLQKQESKTFGLIGSLKSKLSSIDINMIQNTVTTFFDPAYNEPKTQEPGVKDMMLSQQQTTNQSTPQSSFNIFVPSVEQHSQPYNYPAADTNYYGQTQFYQEDAFKYYNQGRPTPVTSFFQDPDYEPPQTGPNIDQQTSSGYAQTLPATEIHHVPEFPIIPVNTEVTESCDAGYITSPNIAVFDTIHSDKIECLSKTKDTIQKEVDTANKSASTIPIKVQIPFPNTSATDISAKSFFDSSVTINTPSIDLLYAMGDKAENDTISKDIKTKIDFTLNDTNDRGEDKIFDEVLSSIIGEETPIGSKIYSKEVETIKTSIEETKSLFPEVVEPYNSVGFINPMEVKKPEIFSNKNIEKPSPEIQIRETNLLESLTTDAIPIVAVSSVPLFGLSTIIADKSIPSNKDHSKSFVTPVSIFEAPKSTFFDKHAGASFFEHITLPKESIEQSPNTECSLMKRKISQHLPDLATEIQSASLFDEPKEEKVKSLFEEKTSSSSELLENAVSELSICETCREFNKSEEKEAEDLTTQLIDNLTSRIQLSNPVEAPLTEGTSVENRTEFDSQQFAEITHITEETIDTINVQSATELLDDEMKEMMPKNYGWCEPGTYSPKALSDHDYSFKLDANSIGFFGNNSLFFDNVPNNASDEIKAELKNSHEDMLTRQVIIPSAPPAEDDTKSEETGGLDVHSIEQDAKKDFPIYEEFVIEPSETDDDKIEYKEREKSEDPVPEIDSFTNRVEKFKKMEENVDPEEVFEKKSIFDIKPKNSPAISIASYFDTGNYAAETHYRNSFSSPSSSFQFGSPNIPMRIPPGFEDDYERRTSGASLQDKADSEKIKLDVPYVPEPTTHIPVTATTTYIRREPQETEVGFDIKSNLVSLVEDDSSLIPIETKPDKQYMIDENITKEVKPNLPDPINFFSSEPSNVEAPQTFNRLASYFASPNENKTFFDSNQNKTDINTTKPHKSFFELSQGQNHYIDRNIPDDKRAVLDVMRDLTSIQNIVVTKEQVVRTVNYFTVEYDKVTFEDKIKDKYQDDDHFTSINDCEFCFQETLVHLIDGKYKVRQLMNDSTEGKRDSESMENSNDPRRSVTLNLDTYTMEDDAKDGATIVHENRSSSEYSPVKYHWFYSVDVDDKSIWRGFSISDSRALEEAYNSSDLNQHTVVATDGGRYDVNVTKRLRTAVYWTEKPTDVSRCSWFYKGPTDARYVPYSEVVAEKLEEEYHHGMTTGEWHRRLLLPNNELVVMHGPSVMVHFLHSSAADAFSAPPQSTSRPRVVRRGHDESELEDSEPTGVDHLLLLCHGVGSACDMRFRPVEEVVDDFRATSLQLVQSHYKSSYDNGVVSRIEVLPISWHSTLHSGETGVDRRLAQITLDSIPRLRNFTNDTVLDVLFYTSPVYCQTIIDTVCSELNRIYSLFVSRNPGFNGRVSLGGHSLGSVILYDLLCHQQPQSPNGSLADKKLVTGSAGTGQLSIKYPKLKFKPAAMYALGSPIAIFECIRGVESLGTQFALPTCDNFFNIFHPYDPIAYRIEPLIHPRLRDIKPSLIPHHKGRKRMHLELKETMSRVGADLKQKLIESLRTTWNKWMAQQPTDGQLEKVVEEQMEKEQLCDENKEELEKQLATSGMLGKLNGGRRVDYVLQEAPLEIINEYLFAMRSHVGYWESEDTMLLMLREIYGALGVQPDGTLPLQGMTVQRTRNAQDETIIIDHPSTSHGTV